MDDDISTSDEDDDNEHVTVININGEVWPVDDLGGLKRMYLVFEFIFYLKNNFG